MDYARWRKFGAPLALAALAAITYNVQLRADAARPVRKDEIVYLPNEKLLTHFTAGMGSVIADFLWLRCVQMTGIELQSDHNFAWLSQMLSTITRMDPYFKDAYRFGGIFLASAKADDAAALELLQRGMLQRPDSWELPYEAAMIHLLNRRDEPTSRKAAAYYLSMAVSTRFAPRLVVDLAEKLQGEYNLEAIEADMWTNLLLSDNKVLRELAERKQQELAIRANLKTFDELIARFQSQNGRAPASMEDLAQAGYFGPNAAGNLSALLSDPLGGRYEIGADGRSLNTTLLDNATETRLNTVRDAVKKYNEAQGAYPPTLEGLVPDFLPLLEPHPYPGKQWIYNPITGEVAR